ncbi:MAG TPA: BadF/BadG/BcrA/BcrD ATPase family protein, partial [Propionibacteriaceae bacterium]|nr:BadF/BadG/BcrA/BcrD ATPase family protein [Propionibacteriaceae bacterium]
MPHLALGLDVGSTTVKAVVLEGGALRWSSYRRHNADARGALRTLLAEVSDAYPDEPFHCAVTGSAGLGVADVMGVEFVQEVIAGTAAIERFEPAADVVIELGGEDAKITFLHPVVEQRMNGTCAGGTGAFIDQMASLLHTDAAGLDALAAAYSHLYPIASRCGVFAKSDLQPLLNQGAAHTDLAASVFQAVATQTIAGLACGHPIRGNVVFLGGPLHFLPQLRAAYERALAAQVASFTTPDEAHLFVAMGAALLAAQPATSHTTTLRGRAQRTADLVRLLGHRVTLSLGTSRMRPLFADDAERSDFSARHHAVSVPRADLASASGPLFLGIDAGSTTVKAVLLTATGEVVFDHYQGSNDPVHVSLGILRRVL